jgi:hypothetical protein
MRITIERDDPRDRLPTDRHPRPRSPLLLAQLSSLDDEDSAAPRRLYEGGPAVKASVRSLTPHCHLPGERCRVKRLSKLTEVNGLAHRA